MISRKNVVLNALNQLENEKRYELLGINDLELNNNVKNYHYRDDWLEIKLKIK